MRRWLCALALVVSPVPGMAADLALRFIGQQTIATDAHVDGTVIGGLSGIDYDPATGRYIAISDDRSRHDPARFYEVDLALTSRNFSGVRLGGVRFLQQPGGGPYPADAIDAESIRFSGGDLLYTSEGSAKAGAVPFIRAMAADGRYVRSFSLPAHYLPGGRSGIRKNRAFESLTVSNDGARILAATEAALVQDGGGHSRIVSFDRTTGQPVAEYVYEIEDGADGLSELLALEGSRYLALERSAPRRGQNGCSVRIFLIDLAAASNVLNQDVLDRRRSRPVTKSLLFDLGTLGLKLDNIEGMTFGPTLDNGRRSLILVSDNNFSRSQVTQFLAFDVEPARNPGDILFASREAGAFRQSSAR